MLRDWGAGATREWRHAHSLPVWPYTYHFWVLEELGERQCCSCSCSTCNAFLYSTETFHAVKNWILLFIISETVHLQAGPCCNNPIFAEIVPAHMRNMVYAFDRSLLSHTHLLACLPA